MNKTALMNFISLTCLTFFLSLAEAHARGACVYQQPIPYYKCQVTSKSNCDMVRGTYFDNKTCEQVQQENLSSASVSVVLMETS